MIEQNFPTLYLQFPPQVEAFLRPQLEDTTFLQDWYQNMNRLNRQQSEKHLQNSRRAEPPE